jgi:hypothetical protein
MSPDSGVLVIRAWRDAAGRILARAFVTTDVSSAQVREEVVGSAQSLHGVLDHFLADLGSSPMSEFHTPNPVASIGSLAGAKDSRHADFPEITRDDNDESHDAM